MLINKFSLRNRLLVAVSLVLTAFLGLSAFSLNTAFQASTESAQKKRLKNYVYTILSSADFDEDGLARVPDHLAEPDFSIPNSGLYAQITSGREIVWQSLSSLGIFIALPDHPGELNEYFSTIELNTNIKLANLAYGIVWENQAGEQFNYTLNISEDLSAIDQQKAEFELSLWRWLGGTGLMLLIVQTLILRWGLQPLHDVAIDLHAIESGVHKRLSKDYPNELNQLTQNINNLLDHEQSRRERYKNSLADLAHSLKTPLAVIRGELEGTSENTSLRNTTYEQLNRLSELVDYQLQRAATEGQSSFQSPVSLGEIIHKILKSLDKVYQSKLIETQCEIERDTFIHADEGDMYELLGNLLENSYKYGHKKVIIFITSQNNNIKIQIDDDGKGIPTKYENHIIKRGQRIDTQVEGQGLGLAIASDIIDIYEGTIEFERSHLGGARFTLLLPQ
ncbi:ATP-binding protein [Pseudomonadota bacterium]|nr:ATP-binding protein [Pseudomonadota bacterium]